MQITIDKNYINETNLKKLIAALRSNKYCKITEKLKDNNTKNCFCVLGLACEISGLGKWTEEGYYLTKGKTIDDYDDDYDHFADTCLSIAVRDFYGFPKINPFCKVVKNKSIITAPLATLNDEYDLSFPELADALEKNYLS